MSWDLGVIKACVFSSTTIPELIPCVTLCVSAYLVESVVGVVKVNEEEIMTHLSNTQDCEWWRRKQEGEM